MKKKKLSVNVTLTPQLDSYLNRKVGDGIIGKSTYMRQLLFADFKEEREEGKEIKP